MNPLFPLGNREQSQGQRPLDGMNPLDRIGEPMGIDSSAKRKEIGGIILDGESNRAYLEFMGRTSNFNSLTGLWNVKTNQVVFKLNCPHADLAKDKELQVENKTLKEGWYGFNVHYGDGDAEIGVSPMSGQFGGVPIQHHSEFEGTMQTLFSHRFPTIMYYQLNYDRGLERRVLQELAVLHRDPTTQTLSNDELLESHPTYAHALSSQEAQIQPPHNLLTRVLKSLMFWRR